MGMNKMYRKKSMSYLKYERDGLINYEERIDNLINITEHLYSFRLFCMSNTLSTTVVLLQLLTFS